jgi:hypothetical protein
MIVSLDNLSAYALAARYKGFTIVGHPRLDQPGTLRIPPSWDYDIDVRASNELLFRLRVRINAEAATERQVHDVFAFLRDKGLALAVELLDKKTMRDHLATFFTNGVEVIPCALEIP